MSSGIEVGAGVIRVAFFLDFNENWIGGINYYRNLFQVISEHGSGLIKITVFTNEYTANLLKDNNHIDIVIDKLFIRKSVKWFVNKIMHKFFNCDYLINKLLNNHNIDIVSHLGDFIYKTDVKTIGWIPDFQHLHLPYFFNKNEINARNKIYSGLINKCDGIILSSFDAKKDAVIFKNKFAIKKGKEFVLQFAVSGIKEEIPNFKEIKEKFEIGDDYFFLPNQYWKHKNHSIVLRALCELKKRNEKSINIISSGITNDYRNEGYFKSINEFIKNNDLTNNYKVLGKITYKEVLALMYYCKAVINPSLFEGWSTSVEEAKLLNKKIILSDIPVHKEQNPINGVFFNPNEHIELANLLIKFNKNEYIQKDYNYTYQQKKFAEEFENIIVTLYREL